MMGLRKIAAAALASALNRRIIHKLAADKAPTSPEESAGVGNFTGTGPEGTEESLGAAPMYSSYLRQLYNNVRRNRFNYNVNGVPKRYGEPFMPDFSEVDDRWHDGRHTFKGSPISIPALKARRARQAAHNAIGMGFTPGTKKYQDFYNAFVSGGERNYENRDTEEFKKGQMNYTDLVPEDATPQERETFLDWVPGVASRRLTPNNNQIG